ncbi:MAG: hypothetical protein HFG26_07460 [Provencibacterium sp.]|jgi:hypothetical protein|nr:hypothetical protein [Provencibacterium sp.]
MKIAFSAMLNPFQGASLSRQSGTKVDELLGKAAQAVRGDRVSISEKGRQNAQSSDSFLKNLIERKSYLQNQRKALLTTPVEDPNQKETVKWKIKELDKQLNEVNQQMADYLLQKQQEAVEKDEEKKEKELTPEEAREKQMQELAAAQEKLDRSSELGVTRAVLNRSLAHEEEWAENSASLSSAGSETMRSHYTSTVSKLEQAVDGLKHAQQELTADAGKLTEKGAEIARQAAVENASEEREKLSTPEEEAAEGQKKAEEESED